jgi:hypothetical protein
VAAEQWRARVISSRALEERRGCGEGAWILRTWGAAVLRPYKDRVAEIEEIFLFWVGLDLNPHPLTAKGAAPKGRLVRMELHGE